MAVTRRKKAPESRALVSKTLGKYEVKRRIGRGSMGTVYLGHDPFAGRDVAIKVARPEKLNDKRSGRTRRKLFFNEAQLAGRLHHPNIVSIIDAGVEDDVWFLVMEYVPGGETLEHYCRPGGLLPIDDVVDISYQCAKALDYAHREGVVHRDIKPKNIMLTRKRRVRIGDFGVALITDMDTASTQVTGYVGSPLYMSPEQLRGDMVTGQADLFSLGVVICQLLSGRHPFKAETLAATTDAIAHGPHAVLRELRADMPPVLEHIIERLLKKHPAGRYATGLDLAGDLSLVFDHLAGLDAQLPVEEQLGLVRNLSFFEDFAEDEVRQFIKASVWQDYAPGQAVMAEGDMGNSFYVLTSGEVTVRRGRTDVDTLQRGDCFGEIGFATSQHRNVSVIALNSVSVLKVRAALLERASPGCRLSLQRALTSNLADRLDRAMTLIDRISAASTDSA